VAGRYWGAYSRTGLGLAAIVFVLDRVNKHLLVDLYDLGERGRVALIPVLDLVLVWNRGVSYGLLPQDGDLGRYLLAAFAVIVSAVLALWLARAEGRAFAFGLGLVIGGALSNAVDRLIWGAVADFYSLHAFGFYWYVFNLADAAIVAGVAGLLYVSFFAGHKSA
jgi:signal peptidase II